MGVGELLGDELGEALLVDRVHEREQGADRHGLDALARQTSDGAARGLLVEGRVDRAVEADALRHAEAPAPRYDGARRLQADVPDVLLVPAPQLDLVAKAVGGEQPRHRAVALDQRVVRDRGAVHERLDAPEEDVERQTLPSRELVEPFDDRERAVLGRAEALLEQHAFGLEQGEVGEGPADVDADAPAHAALSPPSRGAAAWPAAARRSRSSRVAASSIARSKSSTEPVSTTA